MIPRLHRRGNSFKGVLAYILHDPGKESSERVAWVLTENMVCDPEDAWFEMFDTYRNRTALKKYHGTDLRGRDNKNPVLHYTLSWHASDNPEPEHMKAMALDSLKALGLSEHETVMACHSDKEHHHVHVVVNTVHPYTGKTAPLKFSKMEFSRWAEAYEKEHGIHCEQRIKNNERRREIAKLREAEREKAALALLTGRKPPKRAPFVPVNDNSPNRRRWFERKEVVEKMKALRAALDKDQKLERGDTWAKQKQQRADLDKSTHAKLDQARAGVRKEFKGQWRDLYQAQKKDARQFKEQATHTFERAVFVFRNRVRLGDRGKPLGLRQMIPLIVSRKKLKERIGQIHMRERRALARQEKTLAKAQSEKVWQMHYAAFNALRVRQANERHAERQHQKLEQKEISFAKAKDALIQESERAKDAAAKEAIAKVPVAPKRGMRLAQPRTPESAKEVLMRGAPQREAAVKPNPPPEREKLERDAPSSRNRDAFREAAAPTRGMRLAQPRRPESAKDVLMRGAPQREAVPSVKPKPPPEKQKPEREVPRGRSKQAFKEAAAPIKPKQFKDEKARQEFMRKAMEQWKRRRARDDFERER